MSVVRVFECKGWTAAQYDELIGRMDLGGHTAPGVLFHVAGPTDEGFRVIDVYTSVEAADRLASERIIPIATELGLTPPDVSQFEVHGALVPSS
jgi:hypothetical protein